MYLIFDLETTGLPRMTQAKRFANFKYVRYYDTSRIVSMSWIHLDKNYKKISSNYFIIKPDAYQIPKESSEIHGITTEYATKYGVPILDVFKVFKHSVSESQQIVAHNIRFDKSVLLSELYRYKQYHLIDDLLTKDEYCTMMQGKKALNKTKFPKLAELYKELHGIDMQNAHNALYDTMYCTDCFVKLNQTTETLPVS